MNISTAIDGYLTFKSTHASHRTIKTDRVILDLFTSYVDDCSIHNIHPDTIRAWITHLQERNLADPTIRRYHATVGGLYTWLTSPDINLTDINPVQSVKPPKLPDLRIKYLSNDDIQSLLDATQSSHHPRRDKALILFLLDTGCRATEATEAKLSNLDQKTGKLLVIGKRKKERYVYLGRRALSALWLYISQERTQPTPSAKDTIFTSRTGDPLNRHSLRHIIRRLAGRAGVAASPHTFRHTCAVEHLRNGMDLFSLKNLLGHRSIKTTQTYLTALSDHDVETQALRTSPSDNWRL